MTSGFCSRAARSRRSLLVGLALIGLAAVASPVLPAHAADSSAKAFLQQIYQKYVGSSADAAKGVPLAAAKEVRGYPTVGSPPPSEDRASAAKRASRRCSTAIPSWATRMDISNLAVDVKGDRRGEGDRHRHLHQFRKSREGRGRAAPLRQGLAHRRYPMGRLQPARPLPQEGSRGRRLSRLVSAQISKKIERKWDRVGKRVLRAVSASKSWARFSFAHTIASR